MVRWFENAGWPFEGNVMGKSQSARAKNAGFMEKQKTKSSDEVTALTKAHKCALCFAVPT